MGSSGEHIYPHYPIMDEELSVAGLPAGSQTDPQEGSKNDDYKVELSKIIAKNNKLEKKLAEAEQIKAKYEELLQKDKEKDETLKEVYTQKTQIEREKEIQSFYAERPEIKEYQAGIEKYAEEHSLTREKAAKLYLAEHHPEMLADEAFRNKLNRSAYTIGGTGNTPAPKRVEDMSPQEVLRMVEKHGYEQKTKQGYIFKS